MSLVTRSLYCSGKGEKHRNQQIHNKMPSGELCYQEKQSRGRRQGTRDCGHLTGWWASRVFRGGEVCASSDLHVCSLPRETSCGDFRMCLWKIALPSSSLYCTQGGNSFPSPCISSPCALHSLWPLLSLELLMVPERNNSFVSMAEKLNLWPNSLLNQAFWGLPGPVTPLLNTLLLLAPYRINANNLSSRLITPMLGWELILTVFPCYDSHTFSVGEWNYLTSLIPETKHLNISI